MTDGTPATAYQPPKGSSRELLLEAHGRALRYEAVADWLVLRKNDKPIAEMFFVSYRDLQPAADRPVTFVFNGGPGAASAYLHVGALGPKRVLFQADGSLTKPPARLVDNAQSWLPFTDLVFVDPIGTGFSRVIEDDKTDKKGEPEKDPKEKADKDFYRVNRDIDSLGEFIAGFLSKFHLWSRPVFIAGESYGGFRVAKLARKLQQGFGVGLNGAILISPALELVMLEGTDYDVLFWIDVFPSMALAAHHHGRSSALPRGAAVTDVRAAAEEFASRELSRLLVSGASVPETEYRAICGRAAAFLGLPEAFVLARGGRITREAFVRELLRSEGKVCGLYDATAVALDPFPDRDTFQGADPTLFAIERAFTGAINTQLREVLGLETERDYRLLSLEVNEAWKIDGRRHALEFQLGATDDLRYGMVLNAHMHVCMVHGLYDLVTPYFTTERISRLMRLQPSQHEKLSLVSYRGGHMFYVWDESRSSFHGDMARFYSRAT